MKTILPQFVCVCTAALAVFAKAIPAQQELLVVSEDIMAQQDKVPGHNNAIYDLVPKEDQIYKIEFLDILPTPIVADRVFLYLTGYIPYEKRRELALPDPLVNATLTLSGSVVYEDGTHDDERSYTFPLKTESFNIVGQLTIRDWHGHQVDFMPTNDASIILVDFRYLTLAVRSGMWTFKVDARAGDVDNTCLFAMSLTQWLEGEGGGLIRW